MTKRRRVRKATVEGRLFTVKAINRIIIVEKIFTIIVAIGLIITMGIGAHYIDNDITAMLFVFPLCLYMIFSKKWRIPVLKLVYNFIDEMKCQEVWYDEYDDYEPYYQYEDAVYGEDEED